MIREMKQLTLYLIAAMLLCGLLFTNAAAEDCPIESEFVQIGGNDNGMVEHSVYSDYDTMYRLAAALGRSVRELPKEWNGYHLMAVMLSLRPDENPPQIIRPDRAPDRIEMGEEMEFYLWDVPAKPFVDAIGPIHVYYAKDTDDLFATEYTDDLFVVTITPWDWIPDPVEEPNGMHLAGFDSAHAYEAYDQKNPVQPMENGPYKYLRYSASIYHEGLSVQNFKEFLINLP